MYEATRHQWSWLSPRAKKVPRPVALVGPRSKEVPRPNNLCMQAILSPDVILGQLADKLQVPVEHRTCRFLVPHYWTLLTIKGSPCATDWSDLLAVALEMEYAPGSTSKVRDCLAFHAPQWNGNKMERVVYAWSKYKRMQQMTA